MRGKAYEDCTEIAGILVAILLMVYLPWIVGGALAVIFCFWNEWYVAGVIIGLFAIFAQIAIGSSVWDDVGSYSSSDDSSSDRGFGFPEMFIAYKFGERNGKNKDD